MAFNSFLPVSFRVMGKSINSHREWKICGARLEDDVNVLLIGFIFVVFAGFFFIITRFVV